MCTRTSSWAVPENVRQPKFREGSRLSILLVVWCLLKSRLGWGPGISDDILGTRERGILALCVIDQLMTVPTIELAEIVSQVAMRVDGGMLPGVAPGTVFELLIITLVIGFALGYTCAMKAERARMDTSIGTKIVRQITTLDDTQLKGIPRRTIGTQSQATYKRDWATPRFHALPPGADGVFDASFST